MTQRMQEIRVEGYTQWKRYNPIEKTERNLWTEESEDEKYEMFNSKNLEEIMKVKPIDTKEPHIFRSLSVLKSIQDSKHKIQPIDHLGKQLVTSDFIIGRELINL